MILIGNFPEELLCNYTNAADFSFMHPLGVRGLIILISIFLDYPLAFICQFKTSELVSIAFFTSKREPKLRKCGTIIIKGPNCHASQYLVAGHYIVGITPK